MERELKMQFAAGQAETLRDALLLSPLLSPLLAEPPRTEHLVSTYFDTADFALHRRGVSLRVRVTDGRRVQTLKVDGPSRAGLYTREEFESSVDGDSPDPYALLDLMPKDSDAARLMRDHEIAARLEPVFVTRVDRSVSMLRLPQGDEVELSLDEGVVEAGDAHASIHEVEMELKHGDPDHLYQFALDLLDIVPLRISTASKGDRGYRLVAHEPCEAVRAQPLKLKRGDSVEHTFQRIAENCLAQIHGNEHGVVSSHDPSNVHQMRVGLRRLRSAFDLFEALIAAPPSLQAELKWIASELGGARDWEVLAGSTLPPAFAVAPDDTNAAAVTEAVSGIARRNRERAAAAVDSVRYTRLIIILTRWLDTAGWRDGLKDSPLAELDKPIAKFANSTLSGRHRKLLKRGHRLPDLDAHRRHRARIAAKKLRYAVEFFASLYPKTVVQHYSTALAKLQDDLGWRNDVVVADGLLKTLSLEQPGTAAAAGFARGYLASNVAADHDALRKLWKRFRRLSPPQ